MALIGNIEQLNTNSDDVQDYFDRMEQFFLCNCVEDDKKVPLFLTLVGGETYKILKNLVSPDLPSTKTYVDLKTILLNHFKPKTLIIAERFKFYQTSQESNESIAQFIVKLRNLASKCEFGPFLQEALRDKFVCGLKSEQILRKLLAEVDLTFNKATQIALAMEASLGEVKIFQGNSTVNKVHHQPNNRSKNEECHKCGKQHDGVCPATKFKCFKCGKKGHFSNVCRSKKIQKKKELPRDKVKEVQEEERSDSEISISQIETINVKNIKSSLFLNVTVNDKVFKMEVDTGASVTVMSLTEFLDKFPDFSLKNLKKCNKILTVANGGKLKVKGQLKVKVKFEGLESVLSLILIDSRNDFNTLMGRSWLDQIKPNWRESFLKVNNINENYMFQEFNNVFKGNSKSCIKNFEVPIVLKDNIVPIFHRAYPMPYALKEAVDAEIDSMVKDQILKPVRHSEWASPIVVVPKKDTSKIRICVDFKVTLNKCVKTDHYPLPRVEDVFQAVSKGKIFTILDLSNAYLQLKVHPESQKLLTINTHKGLYQYTRLPFGLSSAPTQFQSVMDQVLKGLPLTACYLDDVIIAGKDMEECKSNVVKVLQRLESHNIRVNFDKCKFFEESVSFLGHVINRNGIAPQPSKLEAIKNAPRPLNLKQLRSYLGLINYYHKFMPMVSSVLKPLYSLENKDTPFTWNEECQTAFEKSKELLINSPVLAHFCPDSPIYITTDASPYGIGAILSQILEGKERIVMCMSSSLNKSEQNYAHIQKEALAVVVAVKKFHKYIYGRKFTLICDSKPLKYIFDTNKQLPTVASLRLQRWSIILSAYQYSIEYRKGSLIPHVDCLSRLPVTESREEVVFSFNNTYNLPLTYLDIASNSERDSTISRVMQYLRHGWPNKLDDYNLKPYYSKREEFTIEANCLLRGNRVVIPYNLREQILELLHDQHVGIVRTKMLARSEVWWPQIDCDIEQYLKKCEKCQLHQNKPASVTLHWSKANRNFERVHIDFFQKFNNYFLLIVDSYSKWIDIHIMKNGTNAEQTIEKLCQTFSFVGLPEVIVSDNGPPFNSTEFKDFLLRNGIQYTFTPPYHPKSNGMAEKQVHTIKQNLIKTLNENNGKSLQRQVSNFLFKFRNTPQSCTGVSPSSLVFKQIPRTKLSLLNPNKNSKSKPSFIKIRSFNVGENVYALIYKNNKHIWMIGKIIKVVSKSTYLVEVDDEIKIRFVHADQLKHRELESKPNIVQNPVEFVPTVPILPKVIESELDSGSPSKDILTEESKDKNETSQSTEEVNLEPNAESSTLRRSIRIKKKPDRLNL